MRKLANILDLSHIKNKRFIIIGDQHGCYDQLLNLLTKCNYNKKTDVIVGCGDMVDRGDKSYEVIKFFQPDNPHEEHNIFTVMGNHDDKFKRYLLGNKITIGKALQKSVDEFSIKCPDLIERASIALWLSNLPHIIRLPDLLDRPCYIVHAGIDTRYPIDQQSQETCIYIRGINPKNFFDESAGLWYDTLDGSYYILSGHISSKVVNPVPWNFSLDAGCASGGKLRAMVIENNKYEIVEVDGFMRNCQIPKEFRVQEGIDGERLITPGFAVSNSAWKAEEHLWLRSLHIDKNDEVISCGFPKFFNMGDGPREFQITQDNLLDQIDRGKPLLATLKIDGSLLIRFVHNGKVRFRTRGSMEVGLDNKDEIEEFLIKYPKLADPTYYPTMSLLFEWTSPKNQIVIKYDIPELTLVGAVLHGKGIKWYDTEFDLIDINGLKKISEDTGISCVQHFNLKNRVDVLDLIEKLKAEKEIEGYVIRMNNDQDMVKVKSDNYFILHALKSNLNTESLIDLILSWNLGHDYNLFKEKFIASYDYETWTVALPAVSSIFDGFKHASNIGLHINRFVDENRDKPRKEFALLAQQKYSGEKLSACFSLLDNKPIHKNAFKTWVLQNCKQYEFSMFKKEIKND